MSDTVQNLNSPEWKKLHADMERFGDNMRDSTLRNKNVKTAADKWMREKWYPNNWTVGCAASAARIGFVEGHVAAAKVTARLVAECEEILEVYAPGRGEIEQSILTMIRAALASAKARTP